MVYNLKTLEEGLKLQDIEISKKSLDKFRTYMELLIYWNERINLTAIKEPEEIIVRHFLDSLSLLWDGEIKSFESAIDIGTGAGFPGIPIKILKPDIKLVLLDSTRKRTNFLSLVIGELGLEDVDIIHERAEFLGKDSEYREKFQLALSRAVAPLRVLAELSLPFVEVGGYFLAYKGPAAEDEIRQGKKAIKRLGGKYPPKIKKVKVPFSKNQHNLVYTQKTSKTEGIFPRMPNRIKKSPL